MSRPFTRTQVLENRAFLKALARTGNVRLACRELGLKYGTMQHRRRRQRVFAARWDAALVVAEARLARVGVCGPSAAPLPRSRSARVDPLPQAERGYRTAGGEVAIVRRRDGKLQVRRAQRGKLTLQAEQAFLLALSATCNVALAAAAVGAAEAAFHRRRRKDPAFAREMRLALKMGYDALELAVAEGLEAASHEHDEWRANDPPALPPLSAGEAIRLLELRFRQARLVEEPLSVRRRRGESREAHSMRLTALWEERQRLARDEFEVAEAERAERGEPAWGPAGAEVRARLGLPDLAQVQVPPRARPSPSHRRGDGSIPLP